MKFIRLLALLVLSVPIFFISCQKTTSIGANLLPANDGVNAIATDTFTVLTQEEAELPVPTSGMSNYLLGSMKDPVFGTSYAAIFSQVQLNNGSFSWNDSTIVDSMVLSLPFYGAPSYYGIQNVPQTIDVYQMTQSLSLATTYYSNQSFSFNPTPIGVKKFIPNVASYTTSPTIFGYVLAPQVRIKLSSAFVQELLSQSINGVFANNSTLQHFLNGLLIAPDTSAGFGGGIMYFDMTSANIYVYGKIAGVDTTSQIANFPLNSTIGVTTDFYKHNYTGTVIPSLLKSDSANNTVLYLQSMCGLRAKVTIPYLKNLGANTLINKAELELVQIHQSNIPPIDTAFSPPSSVEVLNDSSNYDYTMEDITNAFLTYGGTAIPITNAANDSVDEYVVSVADQVQYTLTGENLTGSTINYSQFNSFFLVTYPNPEIANRIVVEGGGNSKSNSKSYKLVLHLIYTKINN